MSSFHERFFRKNRWGHFMPRGPKGLKFSLIGGAIFLTILAGGIFLLNSGRDLAGQIVLGALLVFILLYNGFVLTRSDL